MKDSVIVLCCVMEKIDSSLPIFHVWHFVSFLRFFLFVFFIVHGCEYLDCLVYVCGSKGVCMCSFFDYVNEDLIQVFSFTCFWMSTGVWFFEVVFEVVLG